MQRFHEIRSSIYSYKRDISSVLMFAVVFGSLRSIEKPQCWFCIRFFSPFRFLAHSTNIKQLLIWWPNFLHVFMAKIKFSIKLIIGLVKLATHKTLPELV
jgi:hypothetical protein